MENWKPIQDFEGIYEVSNLGRVRRTSRASGTSEGMLLTPMSKQGYLVVCLRNKNIVKWKFVHRLVAIAFLPNSEEKPQVHHRDFNKKNNTVNNLEWVTQSENEQYDIQNGNRRYRGERNAQSKNTEQTIIEARKLFDEKIMTQKQIAEKFNWSAQQTHQVVRRKRWKHVI